MIRFQVIALVTAALLACAPAYTQSAASVQGTELYNVTGLKNIVVFPDRSSCFRNNSGCKYHYSAGRQFQIDAFIDQINDVFRATDETGASQDLSYDWSDI